MKGVVIRKFSVIKVDGRMFCDWKIAEYGVDENIENFLRVLFGGLF